MAQFSGARSRGGWHLLDQPHKCFVAFVMLHLGLAVVCNQGQELYRTVRTRTSFEEEIAVIKAVALATLLLTAFLHLFWVLQCYRDISINRKYSAEY